MNKMDIVMKEFIDINKTQIDYSIKDFINDDNYNVTDDTEREFFINYYSYYWRSDFIKFKESKENGQKHE
jgi:hypothetical protein